MSELRTVPLAKRQQESLGSVPRALSICTLRRMTFTVTTADGARTDYNGQYEVQANGVLMIFGSSGPGTSGSFIIRMSPAF